ncbi:MAG: hypothetical protein WA208_06230 [Thermoanaerobaculia bacterium]
MRISLLAAIAALLLAGACRNEPAAPPSQPAPPSPSATPASVTTDLSGAHIDTKIDLIPDVLQNAAIGTERDADGAVSAELATLPANKPLYLTMWFRSSPPELQVAARWLDEKGAEVAVERRGANGEPVVTLAVDKGLPKGVYKVEGYWGGNLVLERIVTVE